MKGIIVTAVLCFLGTSTVGAQSTPAAAVKAHYTRAQLRSAIQNAKTPEDYNALRDYFSHAAELSRIKATEEKQEWDRRKAYPPRKYPSPVDSAHYLYDYYLQDAKTEAAKADHYQQLAQASTKPN
jgi:hypothetical protein